MLCFHIRLSMSAFVFAARPSRKQLPMVPPSTWISPKPPEPVPAFGIVPVSKRISEPHCQPLTRPTAVKSPQVLFTLKGPTSSQSYQCSTPKCGSAPPPPTTVLGTTKESLMSLRNKYQEIFGEPVSPSSECVDTPWTPTASCESSQPTTPAADGKTTPILSCQPIHSANVAEESQTSFQTTDAADGDRTPRLPCPPAAQGDVLTSHLGACGVPATGLPVLKSFGCSRCVDAKLADPSVVCKRCMDNTSLSHWKCFSVPVGVSCESVHVCDLTQKDDSPSPAFRDCKTEQSDLAELNMIPPGKRFAANLDEASQRNSRISSSASGCSGTGTELVTKSKHDILSDSDDDAWGNWTATWHSHSNEKQPANGRTNFSWSSSSWDSRISKGTLSWSSSSWDSRISKGTRTPTWQRSRWMQAEGSNWTKSSWSLLADERPVKSAKQSKW